jgi:hypothetical protein
MSKMSNNIKIKTNRKDGKNNTMNNTEIFSKIATKTIITPAISLMFATNVAAATNAVKENPHARMKPLVENKIQTNKVQIVSKQNKDPFVDGLKLEDIQEIINESRDRFEIPIPSTKTMVIDRSIQETNHRYAVREIKIKEDIHYGIFIITFHSYSYTFKDQSATFIVMAGEDSWKVNVKLGGQTNVDYLDHDNERALRLIIRLKALEVEESKVVLELLQKKIDPSEIGKPEKQENNNERIENQYQ